jgi:hypothetical protein
VFEGAYVGAGRLAWIAVAVIGWSTALLPVSGMFQVCTPQTQLHERLGYLPT